MTDLGDVFRSAVRLFLSALVVFSAFAVVVSPDADASSRSLSGVDAAFVARINAIRADHDLRPLTVDFRMQRAAATWTAEMVDRPMFAHSSDITTGVVGPWRRVGENVGRGHSVDRLIRAFMDSPSHREIILDPLFTHIGVSSAIGTDGRIYTTHRFASLRLR